MRGVYLGNGLYLRERFTSDVSDNESYVRRDVFISMVAYRLKVLFTLLRRKKAEFHQRFSSIACGRLCWTYNP